MEEKRDKPKQETMDVIKFDDVLTELSLNLDKSFLMNLEVYDFFSKAGSPTERDIMNIKSQFDNITTKLEIALEFIIRSRNLIAEHQGGDERNIVG